MEMNILLVEDNVAEANLIHEAFDTIGIEPNVTHVTDGAQAMDFLLKKGNFAGAFDPRLVILDLNLPKKNGRDVLRFIKATEGLKSIPVAVMTNSTSPADMAVCDGLQGCRYYCKPSGFNELVDTITHILRFVSF